MKHDSNALDMQLQDPPKLKTNTLRVVPLGGLGEVGRNMSVVEMIDPYHEDAPPRILILDCGVLFPSDDEPGVDLILPDFSYIADRLDQVEAICITHGHEDHIGAIPYLLKLRGDIPLVGNEFTLGLVQKKLDEHRINGVHFQVKEGDHLQRGPFALEFLAVNHSIPDALAVLVKTSAGTILDTGDFKMDQLPIDSRITDLRAFAKAGEEGVDLFMVDSTNALNPGFVVSESVVGPEIDKIFSKHNQGVIFATTFASHIHRIQHIVNSALKHRRKIAFLGRSMVRNTEIAAKMDKLQIPEKLKVDLKNARSIPPEQLCIICTGSQGEQLAGLSRMSQGMHPSINITGDDTVIFASSLVPGNEQAVTSLQNRIITLGAKIYSRDNAVVHCSGHANRGELEYIYNVVRPKNVLPIHGEPRHLLENARIAQSTGIDPRDTPTILNGGVLDIFESRAKIVGRIKNGYVFVDGRNVGTVSEEDLVQRRILSEEGFVAVFATVDLDAKKVIVRPRIVAKAVAENDAIFAGLVSKVRKALERAMLEDGIDDLGKLSRVVRRVVGKWVSRELRRSPMILPMVNAASETLV
ncbi:MAG: ribonuclease J [Candidatus Ancillula sp.]|jgi:ribonuclease J|nr:ribonuclease J [Candidatus Ancillula sp.]